MNVGDEVKVIDRGKTYSIYDSMAKKMGLSKFSRRATPLLHSKAIVTNKRKHPRQPKTIYGIKMGGQHFIIAEGGLELTKKSPKSVISGNYNI